MLYPGCNWKMLLEWNSTAGEVVCDLTIDARRADHEDCRRKILCCLGEPLQRHWSVLE